MKCGQGLAKYAGYKLENDFQAEVRSVERSFEEDKSATPLWADTSSVSG